CLPPLGGGAVQLAVLTPALHAAHALLRQLLTLVDLAVALGDRDRLELAPLQLAVDGRDLRPRQPGERGVDLAPLLAQGADALQLVLRRPAFPADDRRVDVVEVLADAQLAGDRPTLLGGHDLLAQLVERAGQRGQPRHQRFAGLQGRPALDRRPARALDALR